MLLRNGADRNIGNRFGNTPLNYAEARIFSWHEYDNDFRQYVRMLKAPATAVGTEIGTVQK